MDGAGFYRAGSGELNGKGYGILVSEVGQRANRQAAGNGKLHGTGGDAGGERPGNLWWIASVAGVDPVDVPVLFEGDDESSLNGAPGCDAGGERDELGCKMLGLDWAWTAVANDLKLRVRGRMVEEDTGEEQKQAIATNIHQFQL
jgi:hypothetical protein